MDEKTIMRSIQDTIFVLNGKWKVPLIIAIHNGNVRFKDLKKSIPKITARVLSKELKHLESNKLIIRNVYETVPYTVEYTLSPYCCSLSPVIRAMVNWGQEHRLKIFDK